MSAIIMILLQQHLLLSGDVELNPGPARIEKRPKLSELLCFQYNSSNGTQESIFIMTDVARRWKQLGIALHFSDSQLDIIEGDRFYQKEACCQELLTQWLQGRAADCGDPPTWRILLDAMHQAGCTSVAQQVEKAVTGEVPPPIPDKFSAFINNHLLIVCSLILAVFVVLFLLGMCAAYLNSPPASILAYRAYLKDYYGSSHYPHYSKSVLSANRPERPISLALVHKEKNESDSSFIQLQEMLFNGSVDKIQMKKTPVNMGEIGSLDGGKTAAKFVLIEGGPGMGKSTLCWQLCRLWREGKLLHEWDLMVIIEIRDESTRQAKNLYDLFYHPDNKIRLAIEQDIQNREGEGLLIFLDGYDELSEEQRNQMSVLQKILTNKLLRKATIVVTSRPTALTKLPLQYKQKLNQHISIAGFNKTEIRMYITLACKDSQLLESFHSYVDNNPFILSVMYNPLHCSIVTELYIQYWENGHRFAPKTLTELYNAFILNLLKYNLPTLDMPSAIKHLPEDVRNNFMKLAELAAHGLPENKYVFTDDVPCEKLGLMVSVKKLYSIRPELNMSYIFLHLTVQEYLSAYYWSQHTEQSSELLSPQAIIYSLHVAGQIKDSLYPLESNKNVTRMPLILFWAGFTKLASFSTELLMIELKKNEIASSSKFILEFCQVLFETQSPQLVLKLLAESTIAVGNDHLDSPLDRFVVAYCIVNSGKTSTWRLTRIHYKHLRNLSHNMHAVQPSDWNEGEHRPSIELFLGKFAKLFLKSFHMLCPFTKSITTVSLFHFQGNKVHTLQQQLLYFPQLTKVTLPQLTYRPALYQPKGSLIMTKMLHLPESLRTLGLFLPHYDVLFKNLYKYKSLSELHIRPYLRLSIKQTPNICPSLQKTLPKFAGKLKVLGLDHVFITRQCVRGITHLLNSVLNRLVLIHCSMTNNESDLLIAAITRSKLKHLVFHTDRDFNVPKAYFLTTLLTQVDTPLKEVTVGGVIYTMFGYYKSFISCDVARVLVEAMANNTSTQNAPILKLCVKERSCKEVLMDTISDKVQITSL